MMVLRFFRDLSNMAFKVFNEKASCDKQKRQILDPTLRSPKETMGHRQLHLGHSNTTHWKTLPQAPPAGSPCSVCEPTGHFCVECPRSVNFPKFLLHRNIPDLLGLVAKSQCGPVWQLKTNPLLLRPVKLSMPQELRVTTQVTVNHCHFN